MSQFEHLFFDPGHGDVDRAAQSLAGTFGLRTSHDRSGALHLSSTRFSERVPHHIGGRIGLNDWAMVEASDEPDAVPMWEDLPMLWALWAADVESEQDQIDRARGVFTEITRSLGWRSALAHEFDVLVAAYDAERGLREFPPGTEADGRGREVWG